MLTSSGAHMMTRDHPREYGENQIAADERERELGPSPRIRGEYTLPGFTNLALGTIPANTGRMANIERTSRCLRDHPREYGENRFHIDDSTAEWGPSPRIRGELLLLSKSTRSLGTIPANTGRILADLRKPDQQD